jgi:hypothetical protein
MRVLDLYCGVGGVTRGFQLAGFEVTGVDKIDQPRYCGDRFEQADALEFLEKIIADGTAAAFALITTSPPCQAGAAITKGTNVAMGWGRTHEQLVGATRDLLTATGRPFVIEQPAGGGGLIRRDLLLCMDMFPIDEPPWVQRHRDFEISGFSVAQPRHPRHRGYVRGHRHGVVRQGDYVAAYGHGGGKATVEEMRHAMQIPWADAREELTEAIPPPYSRYIGEQFLRHLERTTS